MPARSQVFDKRRLFNNLHDFNSEVPSGLVICHALELNLSLFVELVKSHDAGTEGDSFCCALLIDEFEHYGQINVGVTQLLAFHSEGLENRVYVACNRVEVLHFEPLLPVWRASVDLKIYVVICT